ncbi:hypothetical protein STTU_0816 [Streptomyces sp. Tu6071]|nr:hypothetical protein STTU_0816 [Streptomyces sp. Tu6071]
MPIHDVSDLIDAHREPFGIRHGNVSETHGEGDISTVMLAGLFHVDFRKIHPQAPKRVHELNGFHYSFVFVRVAKVLGADRFQVHHSLFTYFGVSS